MMKYLPVTVTLAVAVTIGFGSSVSASVASKTTSAERSLIKDHVASTIADSCTGNTAATKKALNRAFTSNKANNKRVVAAVQCVPSAGAESVSYIKFSTVGAMSRTYEKILGFYPLEVNTKEGVAGTCPVEGQYGDPGDPLGRVGCVPSGSDNSAHIVWTTDASKILAEAVINEDSDGTLVRAFFGSKDAGPI
jgi:hypothetical protein